MNHFKNIVVLFCLFGYFQFIIGQHLIAYISQHGLHGEITFRQLNTSHVEIISDLETTLQYPDQVWSLSVRKFPVDYTNTDTNERCQLDRLGEMVLTFDGELEYIALPGNESSTWIREMQLIGKSKQRRRLEQVVNPLWHARYSLRWQFQNVKRLNKAELLFFFKAS